jgi:hypothetical protein
MTEVINFVAKQEREIAIRDRSDKRGLVASLTAIGIFVIAYVVLLVVNNNYKEELAVIESAKTKATNSIKADSNNELQYLAFYMKVKKLTELIEKRSGGTESLVDSYSYFTTTDTALVDVLYDYYTRTIELTLTSNSVFSLANLVSLIQDPTFQADYVGVEIISLNRDVNGVYHLKVNLSM